MKTKLVLIPAAMLAAAVTCVPALRANNVAPQTLQSSGAAAYGIEMTAFRDSKEAKLLQEAYVILSTGDHDYNGHRVGAMQQVRAAAELLGVDLAGDASGGKPQHLSDDRMRAAKDLIVQVRDSAAVKDQEKVAKHLNEAVHQINSALGIK